MTAQLRELGARLRNLFQAGEFRRRYDDGRIQVQTHNNRGVEKKEAFPCGFCAKAKNGRALVVCQGGDVGSFEIFRFCRATTRGRPIWTTATSPFTPGEAGGSSCARPEGRRSRRRARGTLALSLRAANSTSATILPIFAPYWWA